MITVDIKQIIDHIPQCICYIYPGYITMYLYYYIHSLTLVDAKGTLLKSVAISYFYVLFLKWVFGAINKIPYVYFVNDIQGVLFNVFLALISVVIPCLLNFFQKNEKIESKLKDIKGFLGINTSFAKNEIDVLQKKYHDTIWIYVYMKNSNIMYEGSLTESELEDCKTKFFCLSKYRKHLLMADGKKKKLKDYSNDEKEKVLYFDQIAYFEVANVDDLN